MYVVKVNGEQVECCFNEEEGWQLVWEYNQRFGITDTELFKDELRLRP